MRRMTLGFVALALLACVFVPARVASAEEMSEAERAALKEQASALDKRVIALFREGKLDEALPLSRELVTLTERASGSEHNDLATALHGLAFLLERMGQFEEARATLERGIRLREKIRGPADRYLAKDMNRMGLLLRAMHQYEASRQFLERAVRIYELACGPDSRIVGHTLYNLGMLLRESGHYEEAVSPCERAVEVYTKATGPFHHDAGWALNTLALLHADMGQYAEALAVNERGLRVWEALYGSEEHHVAMVLDSMGSNLHNMDQYEAARQLYERAIWIYENEDEAEGADLAGALGSLASLHRGAGRLEAALPLAERSLRIREKVYGPDDPGVVAGLIGLARVRATMGQDEEARLLLERARGIREKTLGPQHPWVADTLTTLAVLLTKMGRYAEALPLFERALGIFEEAHGPEHPRVAGALSHLSTLLRKTGEYERASVVLRRSLDVYARHVQRHLSALEPSKRIALAEGLRVYLARWLTLTPHLDGSGYAEVLRFKGMIARSTTAERRLARRSQVDGHRQVLDLRAAERRLSKLANSIPSAFPREGREERRKTWQEAYARAAAEREAMAQGLARKFAPFRTERGRMDIGLSEVQAELSPDEVLVDFLRSGDRYLAWVLSSDGDPQRLELGSAERIEAAATEFAERASDTDAGPSDPALVKAGQTLRALICTPIEACLPQRVRIVYLCPDAALAVVPFAALPGKTAGRFLIDDYLVTSVSMAQDLVPGEDEVARGTGGVALGGVDYRTASVSAESGTEPLPRCVRHRAPRGGNFQPLPETQDEVEFVRTHLSDDCVLLLGKGATEARLRAEAPGKRLVHLATHGFVRDDLMRGLARRGDDAQWLGADMERQLATGHDPMLLSGLALAGANPRDGGHGDDGILTALEASHLDLDGTDLVILSACQTALGRAESGEGVIGLVRGFQMAGAERVIASLWRVDDEATRLLMERFYEGLLRKEGPLSPAEALRKAALHVRASTGSGGRSFAHPHYWAAFVAYGN